MPLSKQDVTRHLNELLTFLEPVHSLASSHLGSFFIDKTWNNIIPPSIQVELNNVTSVKKFIELYPKIIRNYCPNDFAKTHPNLLKFLSAATNISLIREKLYLELLHELETVFSIKNFNEFSDVEMEDFMSPKKCHEVNITSKMTALLSQLTQSSHIVDIGGGKGYLSCILALQYSFKVLGLDSSEVTTCGALKISEKIAKLWNGETFKHSKETQAREGLNKKGRAELVQKQYKQIITFVNQDTNVEDLLGESFNEEITGITLAGLHTCGNLASTCLQIFLDSNKVKSIINIGCCYNQITEEFVRDHSEQSAGKPSAFPMSSFLREKKYSLGRNARMLAAHSPDRINLDAEFEFSQTSIFYRAVLEVLLKKLKYSPGHRHVGRLAKKCNNFHEYMSTALKKLGVRTELTKSDFDELYERYVNKKPYLTAFYLLRISLAPVIESIILLDRVFYLIENGIDNAYLVPLFNLEISPRGFGIIAWKNFNH